MNRYLRKQIEKAVSIVLEELGAEIPIDNIDDLVTKLQGRVEDLEVLTGNVMVKKEEGACQFVIQVLAGQTVEHRNYAIAQGLGVLFLHMGYMSNPDLWAHGKAVIDSSSYEQELEYDEFAVNLMMPQRQYLDFVYENMQNGEIDTFAIAKHFSVPNGVAINRGKWLEALQW